MSFGNETNEARTRRIGEQVWAVKWAALENVFEVHTTF